jgi:hypothetical protein
MKDKKIKILIATFLFSIIPGSTLVYGLFFIKKEVHDLYKKYQEETENPLPLKLWMKKELRVLLLDKKIECKLLSKKIKNTIHKN